MLESASQGGGLLPGGVCSQGGVCSGGCLLPGGVCWGVSAPGGSALGGCLLGGVVVSQHALRQTPPCEQNDRQVQKYYLGHNFVAAANKNVFES